VPPANLQLDTVSCRDFPVVLERGKPVGRHSSMIAAASWLTA
jgi:hypothetical protein